MLTIPSMSADRPRPVSLGSTIKAELTKLRTVRSTWLTIATVVGLSFLLALVVAASEVDRWDEQTATQRADFDPTSAGLIGVLFATVIFGSMAIRSVTAEHSTGMIRVSYAAVPRRRNVLIAKTVVLIGITLPIALASNLGGFVVAQRILASKDADTTLSAPGVTQALVFGALAVGVTVLMGIGLGELMRRTATATTLLSIAIIGSQILGAALPAGARPYLPGMALQATVTAKPVEDLLEPGRGLLVLTAYALAALLPAITFITRRDP